MTDFETHPIGTAKRLERLEAVLEAAKNEIVLLRKLRAYVILHDRKCAVANCTCGLSQLCNDIDAIAAVEQP